MSGPSAFLPIDHGARTGGYFLLVADVDGEPAAQFCGRWNLAEQAFEYSCGCPIDAVITRYFPNQRVAAALQEAA